MRTLILYATKSGASKECAEQLTAEISDSLICDMAKKIPDIKAFDAIIVGSGVRMGKFYKSAKNFIDKYTDLLLSKRTAFYLCNAYPDTLQKTIEKNIPNSLINSAACIKSFGGKPPFTAPKNQDWILKDNVKELVQAITVKNSKTVQGD